MSTAPLEALQEGKMGGRAGGKADTQQVNRACAAGLVGAACLILPTSSGPKVFHNKTLRFEDGLLNLKRLHWSWAHL